VLKADFGSNGFFSNVTIIDSYFFQTLFGTDLSPFFDSGFKNAEVDAMAATLANVWSR
jgi:hypothetical protein